MDWQAEYLRARQDYDFLEQKMRLYERGAVNLRSELEIMRQIAIELYDKLHLIKDTDARAVHPIDKEMETRLKSTQATKSK